MESDHAEADFSHVICVEAGKNFAANACVVEQLLLLLKLHQAEQASRLRVMGIAIAFIAKNGVVGNLQRRFGKAFVHHVRADAWLTRSVDRLEKEGYLKREQCGHDARGAYAVLTRKGQTALAEARPVYWAGVRKYFASS